MILLSIDPSLRSTGYGVIASTGKAHQVLDFGVIKNGRTLSQSGCLLRIHEAVNELIGRHKPDTCAVESVIYVQSFRTAITLGAARGVAILSAAQAGIPIHEYAPRRVKQAVVGKGAAQKEQVAFMVRALLGMTSTPPPDAADALAIGLTCLQELHSAIAQKTQPMPI